MPFSILPLKVLEIGSGWGPLAVHITSTIPGTTVDTVTLSIQQAKYVKDRVRQAGLGYGNGEQRVTVHVFDYRNMPAEWEGMFDRLVCVEMIENVGREYIEVLLKTIFSPFVSIAQHFIFRLTGLKLIGP